MKVLQNTYFSFQKCRQPWENMWVPVLILGPGYFDILILSYANNSSVVLGMEEEEKSNTESFLSPIRWS